MDNTFESLASVIDGELLQNLPTVPYYLTDQCKKYKELRDAQKFPKYGSRLNAIQNNYFQTLKQSLIETNMQHMKLIIELKNLQAKSNFLKKIVQEQELQKSI